MSSIFWKGSYRRTLSNLREMRPHLSIEQWFSINAILSHGGQTLLVVTTWEEGVLLASSS